LRGESPIDADDRLIASIGVAEVQRSQAVRHEGIRTEECADRGRGREPDSDASADTQADAVSSARP
jgi:hypothetical protein